MLLSKTPSELGAALKGQSFSQKCVHTNFFSSSLLSVSECGTTSESAYLDESETISQITAVYESEAHFGSIKES